MKILTNYIYHAYSHSFFEEDFDIPSKSFFISETRFTVDGIYASEDFRPISIVFSSSSGLTFTQTGTVSVLEPFDLSWEGLSTSVTMLSDFYSFLGDTIVGLGCDWISLILVSN